MKSPYPPTPIGLERGLRDMFPWIQSVRFRDSGLVVRGVEFKYMHAIVEVRPMLRAYLWLNDEERRDRQSSMTSWLEQHCALGVVPKATLKVSWR